MSDESRLMALLEEGNPATEVGDMPQSEVGAAAYLAKFEQTSSHTTRQYTTTKAGTSTGATPKRWAPIAALAAAMAILVVAGASLSLPLTSSDEAANQRTLHEEDIVGIWRGRTGIFIQFGEDGTYSAARHSDELDEGGLERGTWSLDGSAFVFSTDVDAGMCAGAVGRYRVAEVDDGEIEWTSVVPDECGAREESLSTGPLRPWS